MMDFVRQYCHIIAYSLMGLVFAFASFFLIINLYHQSEVSKTYTFSANDTSLANLNTTLAHSKELLEVNASNYHGSLTEFQVSTADKYLNQCLIALDNDIYKEVSKRRTITILDVYELREAYENQVLADCYPKLLWFADAENQGFKNDYLIQNENVLKLYLDDMKVRTNYLKSDILNNSSYFFNTNLSSNIIRHNVREGFYETLTAYQDVASLVEELSSWYHDEVGGGSR